MASRDVTLFFFRHGQTDWNVDGRSQGHTDIPLNAKGFEQALELAAACKAYGIDLVVTSDLMRASQTSRAIADEVGVELVETTALREVDMGDAAGMLWSEMMEMYGEELLHVWHNAARTEEELAASFPGGESRGDMIARVRGLMEELVAEHAGKTLAVGTHGGVIRHCLGSLFPEHHDFFSIVRNVALYRVVWESSRSTWRFDGLIGEGGELVKTM